MTPELPNILISAKDLYLKAGRHDLVEAVSLEVSEGEIVSVIGPNGAGKTSLLKLLLGLYKPDRGSIRRRLGLRVGYLPQKTSICLLYTSPSPRDGLLSRMPSSA